MHIMDFSLNNASVADHFLVTGIVYMKNGCCEDKPVLVTANKHPDIGINYSCQCACGAWCTTGHPTPVGALRDYQTMSNRNKPLDDDYPRK